MKNTLSWLILAFALGGGSATAETTNEDDPEYQAVVSLCSAEAEGAEDPETYMKECVDTRLAELGKGTTEKPE